MGSLFCECALPERKGVAPQCRWLTEKTIDMVTCVQRPCPCDCHGEDEQRKEK